MKDKMQGKKIKFNYTSPEIIEKLELQADLQMHSIGPHPPWPPIDGRKPPVEPPQPPPPTGVNP